MDRAELMTLELDQRTGLKPRDIDAVFITHEHADHWAGLAHLNLQRLETSRGAAVGR